MSHKVDITNMVYGACMQKKYNVPLEKPDTNVGGDKVKMYTTYE